VYAKVIEKDDDGNDHHTELVIMVVGEAARADHFSLNGYEKKTNPLLENKDIINFSEFYSCGTSTAYSVPCMFSIFDRDDYSYKKGISTQNVLDVLTHTKDIEVLWRDNNSDSKGVALRVPFEDYRTSKTNTICEDNGECRDEGMLVGLDEYIKKNKGKDILIVLHQMGNHGPAYYKRYPKEFEKFTPVCETNQLEQCTQEEISNAYDNALLYTDYFLTKTINFLKKYDKTHETALIYMSDHGESLGENGVYLHGLPYFMAPDSQTNIGAFMWFGEEMKKDIDMKKLHKNKEQKYSQDNLFHTLLGLFEVETKVYDKSKDIIYAD
jgi:lipid A ethanolaminephosphotransferase